MACQTKIKQYNTTDRKNYINCREYFCLCKDDKCNKCNFCRNRFFRDDPAKLYTLLTEIKRKELGDPVCPTVVGLDEIKYKNYNYNGNFHKGLQHNLRDGRLISSSDYEKMRDAIICGDQVKLASVPLATGATVKLANPLASLSTVLLGMQPGVLDLQSGSTLSSNNGAADMVELYSQAIARDVPFIEYASSPIIANLLQSNSLNNPEVLKYLLLAPAAPSVPFTAETIFRGNGYGDLFGPYISQYLLLNFVTGALRIKQIYAVPASRVQAESEGYRVEWGISQKEIIDLQNGNIQLLPPPTPNNKLEQRYIYSGRSLAEVVHNDLVYQFFYQAAALLQNLGAKTNPYWPTYPNQGSFVTNNGQALLLTSLANVSEIALQHAWYWKWQHYRKLRPETFGLWVNDVKTNLVPNKGNFDISDILLENQVLDDIFIVNNGILPGSNSYTLPQSYREGAPLHPAYISGHAIISGACITIIKMFFDGDQPWTSLPGVISGVFSGIPNAIVQANNDGTTLLAYGGDISKITVTSELNKLACNIAFGRNWAGIHYRADAIRGILLGETIAIYYMKDILSTMVENNLDSTPPSVTIRKFDGSLETIEPTLCADRVPKVNIP